MGSTVSGVMDDAPFAYAKFKSRTSRMPTPTRKAVSNKAVVMEQSHRAIDIGGVILVATAIVITIGLAIGNTGVVGEALSGTFKSLFGRGAWAAPVLAGGVGLSMLLGRKQLDLPRLTWGLSLIFLTLVGFMAAKPRGDYFDPEEAKLSGGYIGASVAWGFETLLGSAMAVGLGALGMVGLILCVNAPLHVLLANLAERRKRPPQKVILGGSNRGDRAAALEDRPARSLQKEAVVNGTQFEEEPPARGRTRTAPVIRTVQPAPATEMAASAPTPKEGYVLPPLSLLQQAPAKPKRTASEMEHNIETLERTLEEFGIDANVVEVATGPTITRYEIQLGPGINVRRITSLGDNLAMSLAARDVRVEAPIPGKSAVGVEVPNNSPSMVTLRDVCETSEFRDHSSRLCVALGQDVSGINRYADLTKMPHLLIGGATNSGKSIGLATIITSLLMRNTPKDVRMVMIDPKRVELSLFDGIPHLMCPVVKDVKEAPGVLRAVWREMDLRYDKLSEAGVRNIQGWNDKASFQDKMPYIVVIIDELADLMIQASAEVETSIVRLAQLARAVGIHLVIATQRPSVDVITGTIKANIPSRLAFAVSSQIDSRTILDQAGAERLVGKGDLLFMPIDASKPTRIQGCYVSEKEIEDVTKHWKDQEAPHYVLNPIAVAISTKEREMSEEESDELWEEAVTWVVDRGQASTSMLQRKFSIGFQRASRMLDLMEERGIVGPRDGPRPREVLVDPMQAQQMLGKGYTDMPHIDIDPFEND